MKHCKVLGKPGWGEGEKTNKKKQQVRKNVKVYKGAGF